MTEETNGKSNENVVELLDGILDNVPEIQPGETAGETVGEPAGEPAGEGMDWTPVYTPAPDPEPATDSGEFSEGMPGEVPILTPSETPEAPAEKKKEAQGSHVAIIILIAVLIGVLVYFLWLQPDSNGPIVPVDSRGIVTVPENIEELLANRDVPPLDGYYTITMNDTWTFRRWGLPSENAYVENSIRNGYTVYFELFLEADGKLLYTSPHIPVGASLTEFALDDVLRAGEYPANMVYYLIDGGNDAVSSVTATITLIIQE